MSITLAKIEKMIDIEIENLKDISFSKELVRRLSKRLYTEVASETSSDIVSIIKSDIKASADETRDN